MVFSTAWRKAVSTELSPLGVQYLSNTVGRYFGRFVLCDMISVSPRGVSWIYVPFGLPGAPPLCVPGVLPAPAAGEGWPFCALLLCEGWLTPLGCPGLPVSLPCGVALGAVLALALASLEGAVDGDGDGDGDELASGDGVAAAVFSLVVDSGVLLGDAVGGAGVVDGEEFNCGCSDTSGNAGVDAGVVAGGVAGAAGAGVGDATGVTGVGASCTSCG